MDFVGGLSRRIGGRDYLYVVVDRFSKICFVMACKKTIKGQEAASLFFKRARVRRQGQPFLCLGPSD